MADCPPPPPIGYETIGSPVSRGRFMSHRCAPVSWIHLRRRGFEPPKEPFVATEGSRPAVGMRPLQFRRPFGGNLRLPPYILADEYAANVLHEYGVVWLAR